MEKEGSLLASCAWPYAKLQEKWHSSPENYGTLQEINKEKRVKEEQGKHTSYTCIYYYPLGLYCCYGLQVNAGGVRNSAVLNTVFVGSVEPLLILNSVCRSNVEVVPSVIQEQVLLPYLLLLG